MLNRIGGQLDERLNVFLVSCPVVMHTRNVISCGKLLMMMMLVNSSQNSQCQRQCIHPEANCVRLAAGCESDFVCLKSRGQVTFPCHMHAVFYFFFNFIC